MTKELKTPHYFINSSGDLFLSATDDVFRYEDMKSREVELKAIFQKFADNFECRFDESMPDAFDVKFNFNGKFHHYVLGVDAVTPPGENRSDHEYRVQPRGKQIRYIFDQANEGIDNFWLCFYKREDVFILCAWKSKWTKSNESNGLYKVDADTIAEAARNGFARELRNRGRDAVCAFKPELLPFFLNNKDFLLDTGVAQTSNNISSTKRLSGLPYNMIFFGAPGTGKSFKLAELADSHFSKAEQRRVTFHPEYTYAQFVGCFKPYSKQQSTIEYMYVPGPFLSTYIDAVRHPDNDYLLIIEEINRANPAAVFGDIFQLLDRLDSGESEYPIAASLELSDCLSRELCAEESDELVIPNNMYIWATMNSADQGVFPIDTAFRRRWEYKHIDVNDPRGVEAIEDITVPVGLTGKRVYWDQFRRAINTALLNCGINEDKLLGPFFVKKNSLTDEAFNTAFKNKVLFYLCEDVMKMRKGKLFVNGAGKTFSEICTDYDSNGFEIFDKEVFKSPTFAEQNNESLMED